MRKRLILSMLVLVASFTLPSLLRAQTAASGDDAKWSQVPPEKSAYKVKKVSAPAPSRDLSGVWDALAEGGIEPTGPPEHTATIAGHPSDEIGGQPDESKIEHPLPYTPDGLAALLKNKPGSGVRSVGPSDSNDPVDACNPPGFPRIELYDFREVQIVQTKTKVLMVYELDDNYRVVWTDGRQFPKDPEPRWFGYSTGKWIDDYTFEITTVGTDPRSWIDHVGRPHSGDLKVVEQFHRVDFNTIELSMTIIDSKYYSQPWMAMNKYVLHRLPDNYDWIEYVCAPADSVNYNNLVGKPVTEDKK